MGGIQPILVAVVSSSFYCWRSLRTRNLRYLFPLQLRGLSGDWSPRRLFFVAIPTLLAMTNWSDLHQVQQQAAGGPAGGIRDRQRRPPGLCFTRSCRGAVHLGCSTRAFLLLSGLPLRVDRGGLALPPPATIQ